MTVLKNQSGATLVYVLAAFLIISFMGIEFIKVSHHDVTASSDYSAVSRIQIVAQSGLQSAISQIENNSVAFLAILQDKYYNPETIKWIQGDESHYMPFDAQYSFRSRIISFDSETFSISIECEAQGKNGSNKSLIGIYRLDGIDFKEDVLTGNEYAFFVNGNSMHIESRFYLTGNFFTTGEFNFTGSWCSGSIFDGDAISLGSGNSDFYGSYTFKKKFYAKGKIRSLPGSVGGKTMLFEGPCGFEKELSKGPNNSSTINMKDNCFMNEDMGDGHYSSGEVIDNLNGHTLAHNGTVSFSKVNNGSEDDRGGDIDIPMELRLESFLNPTPPELDISQIPASKILNWNSVPKFSSVSCHGSLVNGCLDAEHAQSICDYARDNGLKWKGFAVVEIPYGKTIYPFAYGTFSDSIIIINRGTIKGTSFGNTGWYNCNSTSMTVVINFGDYNCGQYEGNNPTDMFRGYLFNTSHSNSFDLSPASRTFYNFVGAIHNMRDPDFKTDLWYPHNSPNLSKITYDSALINYVASTGLVKNIGGGNIVLETDELEIIDGVVGIKTVLLGLQS